MTDLSRLSSLPDRDLVVENAQLRERCASQAETIKFLRANLKQLNKAIYGGEDRERK